MHNALSVGDVDPDAPPLTLASLAMREDPLIARYRDIGSELEDSPGLTLGDLADEHPDQAPERDEGPQTPLARATTLCELGRYGDAVPVVAEAISEDPRDAAAWCIMAQAQLGSERPAAALQAARAAASIDREGDEPVRHVSLALEHLGRGDEAVQAAEEATRRQPASWRAQARLARCLARSEDRLEEAAAAASRALELGGEDHAEPHMAAGVVALAGGRRSDAAAAFCAALAVDPLCGEAHNQLTGVQELGARPPRRSLLRRLSPRSGKGRRERQGA